MSARVLASALGGANSSNHSMVRRDWGTESYHPPPLQTARHQFIKTTITIRWRGYKIDRSVLGSHVTRECDGAEQGVFRLKRIEAGMLYDDRHIRFDETGKIGIARDRLRIIEIVEADMPRSSSRALRAGTARPVHDRYKRR